LAQFDFPERLEQATRELVMDPLITFGIGCILCLFLTPAAGALARKLDLLDRPDDRRKLHKKPIPTTGGLAGLVSLSGAAAIGLGLFDRTHSGPADWPFRLSALVAALAICLLGVIDDCKLLRGRHKLLGQLLVAGVVVTLGVRIEQVSFFSWLVPL